MLLKYHQGFQIQIQPQEKMDYMQKDASIPIVVIGSQPDMKSPLSHQQSTPLSINKTHQSNFNLYQQGLLLNSQHQLPSLSPVSDHRPLTKSFTPYPMWYTTQEGKSRKIRQDSFAIFDECSDDEQSDKENVFRGVNQQGKWRKRKEVLQELTPKSCNKPFQQQQQNRFSSKSNSLSNLSKGSNDIKRSIQRTLNCSNIKTTLDQPDGLLLPTSMDSHYFGSLGNMLQKQSQQSQEKQNHHNQHLIHIQQPSPSSSYSPSTYNNDYCSSSEGCGMVGNVQMVLSELPQGSEHGDSLSRDGSSKHSNQVIEYYLTEEDDQKQSCNESKYDNRVLNELKSQMGSIMYNTSNYQNTNPTTGDKLQQQTPTSSTLMLKNQSNRIDYCSILQTKIHQLSNNITILHQKIASNCKSHQDMNSINSQSMGDENKLYPSTMESLDSRYGRDVSGNIAIINHPKQSLWGRVSNKKQRNKLIYHDSKIIFSQHDSGFEEFSEEFSQVLNTDNKPSNSKSLHSQSNVRIVVHNENSPVSIDIQQQMNHVLGCGYVSRKLESANNTGHKSYNLFGREQLQQDIVLEDELHFTDVNDDYIDVSLSSSAPIQKESFRLSFPKLYTQNQQEMSGSHEQSSPKLKSHQSFISQGSNQTFIQQQISNKKFNNKFNQWLMMS